MLRFVNFFIQTTRLKLATDAVTRVGKAAATEDVAYECYVGGWVGGRAGGWVGNTRRLALREEVRSVCGYTDRETYRNTTFDCFIKEFSIMNIVEDFHAG